jgi:hypothetical protein
MADVGADTFAAGIVQAVDQLRHESETILAPIGFISVILIPIM